MKKGLISKGDAFTDSKGGIYTVTSLDIPKQTVKLDYQVSADAPKVPQTKTVAQWKSLIILAGLQEAVTPSADSTQVPAVGTTFRMMDKSLWTIVTATDSTLTIENGKRVDPISVKVYQELLAARYITIEA